MIDYIELGGTRRPVKFGLNTLRIFTKQFKISLEKLGNLGEMTFDVLLELLFAGHKGGCVHEGLKLELTIDQFCDALDEKYKVEEEVITEVDGKEVKNKVTVTKTKLDEMLNIFADQFGGGESEGNQEAPLEG